MLDLCTRELQRIGRPDAVALDEEARREAVGPRADRRGDDAAHGRLLEAGGATQPLEHLVDEARLADPRLRDEAHDLRPAVGDAQGGREQLRQLGVAADEAGLEPLRGEAAQIGRPRIVDTEQPIHLQRLDLAFQGQRAGGLERELALGQLVRGGAHQRIPRAGRRLQARRRVHRVAGHRVRCVRRRAETAGDNPSGVDADVQRERSAELVAPTLAELGRARVHLERRAQGALRVVLVCHRGTEDRDDSVADVLLRVSIETVDDAAQRAEQVGLQAAHVLRVEPLGDGGEAGQVREQHGGSAAIGVRAHARRRRRGPELQPATGTEGKADGDIELAPPALHRDASPWRLAGAPEHTRAIAARFGAARRALVQSAPASHVANPVCGLVRRSRLAARARRLSKTLATRRATPEPRHRSHRGDRAGFSDDHDEEDDGSAVNGPFRRSPHAARPRLQDANARTTRRFAEEDVWARPAAPRPSTPRWPPARRRPRSGR